MSPNAPDPIRQLIDYTSDLVRELSENPIVVEVFGFGDDLNRFTEIREALARKGIYA
ncbi:hypothetical protein G7068_16305 [Leucobacter viscericola]|uniref:Uncharacterized protein n=1 Tax=Leucobacter viscericola TaxID=2714935 RepID=A0A6G7XJ35_9MICO|nr:hypothetical protein [Leucobacter viscericola]QIK64610.1 hypothetical protein G7068_16305 [Leucobacter viscericola]